MTKLQKIIKYLAIGFAIFLTVSIVSGIIKAIAFIGGISTLAEQSSQTLEASEGTVYTEEIHSLKIDIAAVDLKIQQGDEFVVETNSKYITSRQKGETLIVEEKNHTSIGMNEAGTLVITVPSSVNIRETEIDAGAGKIEIEMLNTDELDMDMGVGELEMRVAISRQADIDFGVGSANITLVGSPDDYRVSMDKGIGEATLNGEEMRNGEIYGEGDCFLEMDGGIGDVEIAFEANF